MTSASCSSLQIARLDNPRANRFKTSSSLGVSCIWPGGSFVLAVLESEEMDFRVFWRLVSVSTYPPDITASKVPRISSEFAWDVRNALAPQRRASRGQNSSSNPEIKIVFRAGLFSRRVLKTGDR